MSSNQTISITVESTVSQVGGTERLQANLQDTVDELVKNFLDKAGVGKAESTFILRDTNGVIVKGSKKICDSGLKDGDVVYLSTMEADRALFSYTNWWNISALCLLFGIGCSAAGLIMWFLNSPPPQMFGLVIDAGSVHTSIYTYVWSGEKYQGTGVVKEKYYCEMGEVGISSFVDDPSSVQSYMDSPCLHSSLSHLPPAVKPLTILHLGSTAGMRVLRIQRPKAADEILGNLTVALSRISGIENVNVAVYEGESEAIMGWTTANYLENAFGDFVEGKDLLGAHPKHSYGALDWGGASSQYTIQVHDGSGNYVQKFYGQDYHILARSNLCYGQAEALSRYRVDMMYSEYVANNRTLSTNVTDPCIVVGEVEEVKVGDLVDSPCTNVTDEAFQAVVHSANVTGTNVTFVGSGNLGLCKEMAKKAFQINYCSSRFVSLENKSACFDNKEIPSPGNQTYLAFSTYWYVAQALNLSSEFSLEEFREKVISLCGTSNREFGPGACYKANFMESLLLDGYHFDQRSWKRIKFVKRVSHAEVGWTLGHAILASNDVDAVDGVSYISLPVLVILLVDSALFFLLAVFFAYQAWMINSASAKYQRTRNDTCQILPGDSNSWGKAFLDNVDDLATWANNKKTKVLIISQLLDVDRNYVENELKRNEKTNKIKFHYYEMRDPNGTVHDQESFIHMFEEVGPTVVVLAYQHMIKGDENNKLNPKRSGYAPPGSVAEILNSKKYFSKILLSHYNYLFLRTSNVWHHEKCILTSLSPITKRGVKGQLKEARRSGLLENSPDSRVVIISGGHGYRKKDGRVTSAGGESCFTNKDFLDLKFYEQDVKAIHELRKNPDFDKVCFEVVNIEDYGIYKSKPKQSKLSKWLSSTFCLDTSSSNTNSMYRQSSAGKLVSYLTEFRPTFILISWCFSTNGDLAVALRSQGFFSKLLMEHDLRNITKDPEARLSDQQVEVLREATAMHSSGKKPKYKNFHLVGNSGCGKTILGLEIGKIILAQICQDLQPEENVNVCIMVPKSMTKVPSELIKKLEDDLSFKDLVSAYAVNQKNVQLDYCDSIQQLSQRIKDEISEMPPAKYTVIIADEVTIQAEEVNGELVQDFTSLDRMEDNVWCVYAHSPVDESMINSYEIPFKVKLPLCAEVYTQHLHTRYRNNPEILQFLKFYVSENQDRTLVVDNDHDGARLPPGLAGSQYHPVLWLNCNWSWMDIGRYGDTQLTKEMVHSLVPDMEVFNPNKNSPVGVMVVPLGGVINKEASQHWRWMYRSTCAGMEEEIVVTFYLSFEVLSRARNQLIIVTGTDLTKGQRVVLNKAESKNLLEKIVINDKPDAIIDL